MSENNEYINSPNSQNEQPTEENTSGGLLPQAEEKSAPTDTVNESKANEKTHEGNTVQNSAPLQYNAPMSGYGRPIRYNSNVYYSQPSPYPVFTKSPEQLQKEATVKSLKKAASAAGLSCVLVFAANIVLTVIVLIIAFSAGGIYGAQDIITSDIFSQYLQIFGSLLMFIPPFLITAAVAKKKPSQIVALVPTKEKGWYLPSLFIGYGMCMLANIVGNIISSVLDSAGLGGSNSGITFPEGIYGFLFSTISVAIVPALVEEFAFRGVVLGLLRPYGDGYAIIVSAVLFGLMHGNMEQIPFATIVGLVLGAIVCTTGSVLPAILVHFANNFISVLTVYLTASSSELVQAAVSLAVLAAGMVLMAFGFIILYAKDRKPLKLSEDKTGLSLGEKLTATLSTGGIIGAIIITVISVGLSFL